MRAIDADELIERMYPFVSFGSVDYSELKMVVKSMPTIQPEQRWISVTERLPEDRQYILAYYPEFECGCMVQMYRSIGNYGFKAWMPLPKPWEGDAE